MAKFQIRPATRKQVKLRMAIIGMSKTGKTYSSLRIARGITPKGRIVVIDTEAGGRDSTSSEKYAGLKDGLFQFDVLPLKDHSPVDYCEAIEFAVASGAEVIVIDSLSHGWMGEGGALALVDQAAARMKGSSYYAWSEVTPLQNKLIATITQVDAHVIATMRQVTAYEVGEDKKPRKVGTKPVQREGMEFEFDIVGEMDHAHNYIVTGGTRFPDLKIDGKVIKLPDEKFGAKLLKSLTDGEAPQAPIAVSPVVLEPKSGLLPGNFLIETAADGSGIVTDLSGDNQPSDVVSGSERTSRNVDITPKPEPRSIPKRRGNGTVREADAGDASGQPEPQVGRNEAQVIRGRISAVQVAARGAGLSKEDVHVLLLNIGGKTSLKQLQDGDTKVLIHMIEAEGERRAGANIEPEPLPQKEELVHEFNAAVAEAETRVVSDAWCIELPERPKSVADGVALIIQSGSGDVPANVATAFMDICCAANLEPSVDDTGFDDTLIRLGREFAETKDANAKKKIIRLYSAWRPVHARLMAEVSSDA